MFIRTMVTTRAFRNYCFILMLIPVALSAQTGSASSPFTSVGQAAAVTNAGIYYFSIDGVPFSTYVNNSGELLVAMSYGNATGVLVGTSAMTNTQSGILSATVLAKLSGISLVRITSNGSIGTNLTTTNADVIERIQSNQTLNHGSDDAVLNASWVGTGNVIANCGCNSSAVLAANVIHCCCNGDGMHWIPESNLYAEELSAGSLPATGYLRLWVRGTYTVSGSNWSLTGNAGSNPATQFIGTTDAQPLIFKTNGLEQMRIGTDGYVGIGEPTTPNAEAKLAVKGAIYTTKLKVTAISNWADYVFAPGYRLLPLSEVERFISKNEHLPEVPTATEVQKNGVNIGDTEAVLLKKIEELTLYIIQHDKEIETLKKQVNKHQQKNKAKNKK